MSFAQAIKNEVLHQEFNEEQALAFFGGIISSAGQRRGSKILIKLNKSNISSVVRDLLKQMNIKNIATKENKNWIIVNNDLRIGDIKQPGYYFAGVFVGGGSISDPSSTSYHLEIQFYSSSEANKIKNFLNKYNFDFTLIQRRKLWVLYLKKSDQISDFLKAIQAFNSLLLFEDARIERDFKNQLNRYSNLDTYNQKKLAQSNDAFVKKYQKIKDLKLLKYFRQEEIDFFEIKLKNPYSSLSELVNLYKKNTGVIKTKSGLNHYLIKLRKVFKNV